MRFSGLGEHVPNFILKAHTQDLKCVGNRGLFLLTSDKDGMVGLWKLSGMSWECVGALNRNKTVANDLKMSVDEKMIAAGYEDGSIVFFSLTLECVQILNFKTEILLVDWAPDSRSLLVGFSRSPYIKMIGSDGTYIADLPCPCLEGTLEGTLISLEHQPLNSTGIPLVLAAFSNGRAQLMSSRYIDEEPVLIDCKSAILFAKWNPLGTIMAFCCADIVLFFSAIGENVARVLIPGSFGPIKGLVWNEDGRSLLAGGGNQIAKMRISYETAKGCIKDACAIVHSGTVLIIKDSGGEIISVPFPKVSHMSCWGEDSDLAVFSDVAGGTLAVINQAGITLKQTKVSWSISYLSHRGDYTLAGNGLFAVCWNWKTDVAFSVCSGENPYLISRYDSADKNHETQYPVSQDKFVSASVGSRVFALARESGIIHVYSFPSDQIHGGNNLLIRSVTVPTMPDKIFMNCDDSTVAVIDINNLLFLVKTTQDSFLKTSRVDCWDIAWSADDPSMLACMDKNKLYILRNEMPEEPIDIGEDYFLMGLDQLVTTTLLLPSSTVIPPPCCKINHIPCKALRDCRHILYSVGNVKDAFEFASRQPHAKLWENVAEGAVLHDPMELDIAEKAFQAFSCAEGLSFVRFLMKQDPDPVRQRMLALVWFGRIAECDELLLSLNRRDLLIELKKIVNDTDFLVKLGAEQDLLVLGDHYFDTRRFSLAAKCYVKGRLPCENLLTALLIENNYSGIVKMLDVIEAGNVDLLMKIAHTLTFSGLCEEAVRFFTKAGKYEDAIAACVRLNRWDLVPALEARFQPSNRLETVEARAVQFMRNKQYGELLDLAKQGFAIPLFNEVLTDTIYRNEVVPLMVKKKAAVLFATVNAALSLEPVWRQAEVFHLWALLLDAFHAGRFTQAFTCGLRLASYDEDLKHISRELLWKLIAFSSLRQAEITLASMAFTELQVDLAIPQPRRDIYTQLAADIFSELKVTSVKSRAGNKCCPQCKANDLPGHATFCESCGQKLQFCVKTGLPIFRGDSILVCHVCSSRLVTNTAATPSVCPLCHTFLK